MSSNVARMQLDLSSVVTRVHTIAEARLLPAGTIVGDTHGGVTFSDAVAMELERRSHEGWCDLPLHQDATQKRWTVILLNR